MRIITGIIILFLSHHALLAQCSDAGVCILSHNKLEIMNEPNSSISLGYNLGSSGKPEKIIYHSFRLEGTFGIYKNTTISMSIPYNIANYSAENYSGIGDASAVVGYNIPLTKKSFLGFQLGGKFATGKTVPYNRGLFGDYLVQPGLGTNDLLAAISYLTKEVNITFGSQLPFGRSKHPYEMKRGPDLLFKAGYLGNYNKLTILTEILTIKRLSKNTLHHPIHQELIIVEDSDFMQINLSANIGYKFTKQYMANLIIAVPLLKRDENSDGTKRAFTAGLSISYLFSINN